jgi:hypothetical protein
MTTLQVAAVVTGVILVGIGWGVALYVKHHPPQG